MSVSAPRAHDVRTVPGLARTALVALTVTTSLTSLRLFFPHLYGLKERSSLLVVLGLALAVAASPLLAVPVRRFLGYQRAVVAAVTLLAGWRLLVQLPDDVSVTAAGLGVVAGLVALTLLLAGPAPDAPSLAAGLFGGLALDALILTVAGTWEPAWQRAVEPFAVAVLLATGLLASLARAQRGDGFGTAATRIPAGGGVAVGGVLGLELLFLANPGFVAAAWGRSTAWALALVAVGLSVALVTPRVLRWDGSGAVVTAAGVLAAAGFLLPVVDGAATVLVVVAAQVAAGLVVSRSLVAVPGDEDLAEVSVGAGLFLALVAVLLYQIHYDLPLPVDNRFVTAGLGLLAVAAAGRAPSTERRRVGLAAAGAVATAGLVVALTVAVTTPAPPSAAMPVRLRAVQWNVRQAVADDGRLDPEAVAEALAAHAPDVVVLNEVGRGWPVSGQLDLAGWLARRLDLHLVWGGAASQQFGNLVLSRFPVSAQEVVALPTAGDAQGRSLLMATVELPDESSVRVLATHLQHRNDPASMAARMAEIDEIVRRWGGSPRTILAGDLNPRQGDPPEYPPRVPREFAEISALLAAGLVTAGELDGCTRPTTPRNCGDFVFVSPDLRQVSVEVADLFGDHRLLVSDIALG